MVWEELAFVEAGERIAAQLNVMAVTGFIHLCHGINPCLNKLNYLPTSRYLRTHNITEISERTTCTINQNLIYYKLYEGKYQRSFLVLPACKLAGYVTTTTNSEEIQSFCFMNNNNFDDLPQKTCPQLVSTAYVGIARQIGHCDS